MNFDKKPYMCTYDYWLGGTYLTTQTDGSSDNAIWIMDGLTEFNINIITPDYFVSDIIDLDTSTEIHEDMKAYGIIDSNNNVDIDNLRTALDNIGLGFIHVALTNDQKEQVYIQLQKIVN